MSWLHRGKFMDVKRVKIQILAALQVAKYMRIVRYVIQLLKNRICVGNKLFLNFLVTDFAAPKSGDQGEKQPVLGFWDINQNKNKKYTPKKNYKIRPPDHLFLVVLY